MISHIEFMERLLKVDKHTNEFLASFIRKNNWNLTSLELLLLLRLSSSSDNINIQSTAKKGSWLFQHLHFLLNSLEKKSMISIHSLNPTNTDIIANLQEKGVHITKALLDTETPTIVLQDLQRLDLLN